MCSGKMSKSTLLKHLGLEGLSHAELLQLQRNEQLAEIKERNELQGASKADALAILKQLPPIDLFEEPSIEWRDTHLLDMPIRHCPFVDTKQIIMLHRLWIAGLLGIRVDNLPMLTVVLARNLRRTDNMEADLLFKEMGTVSKDSIPMADSDLADWLSEYNLLVKDLPKKIPAYFNDFIPEDREEWLSVKDVTSMTKEGEVLPRFTTKDKKSPTTTYLSRELVSFINKVQQHDPQIPVEDLCHYFMWAQGQEATVQSACASFLALCTLRLINCSENTVIKNLKSNFLQKFGVFYHKGTPQKWISAIKHNVIIFLKKLLGPGKTAVTTIMVPVLATHLRMIKNLESYSDNDRAVLEYGVLMSTCYTGLYMASAFAQATTKFNDMGEKLISDLWYTRYAEQYQRMAELLKLYISGDYQDRFLWKWSRVLRSNYLSKYSSRSNQWMCALLTAIYVDNPDDNVWRKKCFEGNRKLVELAKECGQDFKESQIPSSNHELDNKCFITEISSKEKKIECEKQSKRYHLLDELAKEFARLEATGEIYLPQP